MRTDGYVKTIVKSGADATLLDVNPLKAGIVTPYDVYGLDRPKTDPLYLFSTIKDIVPYAEIPLCLKGSNTKLIKLNTINFSVDGIIDIGYGIGNQKYITIKIEVIRANFTSASNSAWGGTTITPSDSNDPPATATIKGYPTGLTNEKTIFSGYFHCDLVESSISTKFFQSDFPLHFGEEFGKMPIISDDTEMILFKLTAMSYTLPDFLMSISLSWYET